jgi:hypothetical protein
MANEEHLILIQKRKDDWNRWRERNPGIVPDLSGAGLSRGDLYERNLAGANLNGADLHGADLAHANLSGANLESAKLRHANLRYADLSSAILVGADLYDANLYKARLCSAKLMRANLIGADLTEADLTNSNLKGAKLALSQVAQFIYLLINNSKIRDVINTVTSKVVLILGRFTPERKAILDALREELRRHDLLPVLFDFDKPSSRDIHETVTTLARLARFVVADITEPKSIPQELVSIVESMPSLPIQPLLQVGHEPWGMYDHIKRYPWVLELIEYRDLDDLLTGITERVIAPAVAKSKELSLR